jgi:hypothetical protein
VEASCGRPTRGSRDHAFPVHVIGTGGDNLLYHTKQQCNSLYCCSMPLGTSKMSTPTTVWTISGHRLLLTLPHYVLAAWHTTENLCTPFVFTKLLVDVVPWCDRKIVIHLPSFNDTHCHMQTPTLKPTCLNRSMTFVLELQSLTWRSML